VAVVVLREGAALAKAGLLAHLDGRCARDRLAQRGDELAG
jgi:hypothetical protein